MSAAKDPFRELEELAEHFEILGLALGSRTTDFLIARAVDRAAARMNDLLTELDDAGVRGLFERTEVPR